MARDFSGRVIALTGAASGIGRALAVELAARGAQLALLDRDSAGLEATAQMIGPDRHWMLTGDVTDPRLLHAFAEGALGRFGRIDGIVNNAGLTVVAPFAQVPPEDFDRVMAVNFDAVVRSTRLFLPHVLAAGDGWIVNISSVFGLIGFPTQSAYNASKFAVKGFTEALRLELDVSHPRTCVICVHPGGVKTNVARSAKFIAAMDPAADAASTARSFDQMARTSPQAAARIIADGMAARRSRVLVGSDARVIDALVRLFPQRYFALLRRFLR